MPKQKPSDQIASLRKKQAELMAQLKEAETKARLEAKEIQRRKNELAGAVALKQLEANPSGAFAVALRDLLLDAGGLFRASEYGKASDRALLLGLANGAIQAAPPSKAKKARAG